MKEFCQLATWMLGMTITLIVILSIFILPMMYFGGKGRAAYLKQTQGVDLTWYEAAALDVKVESSATKVEKVK